MVYTSLNKSPVTLRINVERDRDKDRGRDRGRDRHGIRETLTIADEIWMRGIRGSKRRRLRKHKSK